MGWDRIDCGYGVATALKIIIVEMVKSGDSATNNFYHRTYLNMIRYESV